MRIIEKGNEYCNMKYSSSLENCMQLRKTFHFFLLLLHDDRQGWEQDAWRLLVNFLCNHSFLCGLAHKCGSFTWFIILGCLHVSQSHFSVCPFWSSGAVKSPTRFSIFFMLSYHYSLVVNSPDRFDLCCFFMICW